MQSAFSWIYQYGPVCIDRSVHGTGSFEKVFYASLVSMKDRYKQRSSSMAGFLFSLKIRKTSGRAVAKQCDQDQQRRGGQTDRISNHDRLEGSALREHKMDPSNADSTDPYPVAALPFLFPCSDTSFYFYISKKVYYFHSTIANTYIE